MPDERNVYTKVDFKEFYSDRDWQRYKGILINVIRWAAPGEILDIGAGLGFFVECCQSYGLPCLGLEASEYAVKAAKKRGISLVNFLVEEGVSLPFADGEFSAVVSNQFAHHLQPDVAYWMFTEVWRVLQDGGHFFAYEAHPNTPNLYPDDINLYTQGRLTKEVQKIGFTVLAEPGIGRPIGRHPVLRSASSKLLGKLKWEFLLHAANVVTKKSRSNKVL